MRWMLLNGPDRVIGVRDLDLKDRIASCRDKFALADRTSDSVPSRSSVSTGAGFRMRTMTIVWGIGLIHMMRKNRAHYANATNSSLATEFELRAA